MLTSFFSGEQIKPLKISTALVLTRFGQPAFVDMMLFIPKSTFCILKRIKPAQEL